MSKVYLPSKDGSLQKIDYNKLQQRLNEKKKLQDEENQKQMKMQLELELQLQKELAAKKERIKLLKFQLGKKVTLQAIKQIELEEIERQNKINQLQKQNEQDSQVKIYQTKDEEKNEQEIKYIEMKQYLKEKAQMEKKDNNQNVKTVKIQKGYQQTVNQKIQEIFNVLQTSKLQFKQEQLLQDEIDEEENQLKTKNYYNFNSLMDTKRPLYTNTQMKHNRPFIKAVPSGKLFKNEKLIITSEIDTEIEQRARSMSPINTIKEKHFPDSNPWKPGAYYPKLFKEETLLCHKEDHFDNSDILDKEQQMQKQKILNELIRISNSPQKYYAEQTQNMESSATQLFSKTFHLSTNINIKSKEEQIQKLKELQREYQKIQINQQNKLEEQKKSQTQKFFRPNLTIKQNNVNDQQYKQLEQSFIKKSRSLKQLQVFHDTESFAQKKERQQQQKHDNLFKQQEPIKVGVKNQIFSKRIFLENKPEPRARSSSPQRGKQSQWKAGKAVLQTFDNIKNDKSKLMNQSLEKKNQYTINSNRQNVYELKKGYPRIIDDQQHQNKKIVLSKQLHQGDLKKMAQEKVFYYKPHFKDLNSNNIQNQFDKQMFNSFN